jgi:hypothetical protein
MRQRSRQGRDYTLYPFSRKGKPLMDASFLSAEFWIQIIGTVGVPGIFALMLFILRKSDERRLDQINEARDAERTQIDKTREADRQEHMKKWDSMVAQHNEERIHTREEMERLMKLYERQTSAIEMQASLTARMNENILTNQFCPKMRKEPQNG